MRLLIMGLACTSVGRELKEANRLPDGPSYVTASTNPNPNHSPSDTICMYTVYLEPHMNNTGN